MSRELPAQRPGRATRSRVSCHRKTTDCFSVRENDWPLQELTCSVSFLSVLYDWRFGEVDTLGVYGSESWHFALEVILSPKGCEQNDNQEGWQQRTALCSIFACVFISEEVGGSRLMDLMDSAVGIMAYPSRMSVAFCLIYDSVSESFVNLTVVNADETLRTAFSIMRPAMEVMLRVRFALEYRKYYTVLKNMEDEGEYNVDFVWKDAKVMRRVVAVGSGLLCNVAVPILMSACACAFTPESGLDLQAGCEGGMLANIIADVAPGLAIMTVELMFYCGHLRMPLVQYFLFLDPFLVVCAIVVVYLLIALVALTSVIDLETAFGLS
eukprot:TRINITY_DN13247_c0_g1_i5.p1 TRINITY_DN13247_c0_g1~~TRINITY_DN13247_c0_g1_i5.p1  ORF type:complete len:325 (+),score=33.90 TRINITY_DN13247_c0_g1_i5:569-1543(+)